MNCTAEIKTCLTPHQARFRWRLPVWILPLVPLMLFATDAATPASTNEGEWSIIARLAPKSLLLDGVAVDDKLVVVGERGHVLVSRDDGATWHQVRVPTRATLCGVCFADARRGWAVGHGMTIIRTRDGGDNWEKVFEDPEQDRPLLDVWFDRDDRVLALGAYGLILETLDGGDSWIALFDAWDDRPLIEEDEFGYHLNQMARSDTGDCFLAAEAGMLYRSQDAGRTWNPLPSPYEGSFYGILPLTGTSLLAMGLRGHLFRSDDAGETWTQIPTQTTAMLNQGRVLHDGTIVIVGLGGTVLVSTDGGRSVELKQLRDRLGLSATIESRTGTLIVIGESGVRPLDLVTLSAPKLPTLKRKEDGHE